MANLNLSEFTEKLFVADADHTFIWDTAASISKRVSRNSWLNSGTLTSDAPVTISQTWNNAAVAFTGLKVTAAGTSDANSAAASKLLELQIGGVSKFSVDKYGITTSFGAFRQTSTGAGINVSANGSRLALLSDNAEVAYLNGLTFILHASAGFGWASGAASSGSFDTILLRDGAANTLALRNGANAQTFNVYGTYTSGTSYERLTLSAPSAANAIIGTNKGSGGGTARGLEFQTDGVTRMTINAAGTSVIFPSGIALQRTDGGGAIFDFTYNGVQFSNTDGLGVSWSTITGPASSKHVGIYGYASEPGVVQINSSVKGTLRDLRCRSVVQQLPITTTQTPTLNGDFVVEATSNTVLTFKLKGTDGTVRSGTITLA